MAEKLILRRSHWQAMRRHVSRHFPLEACGLLAGKNEQVEMAFGIPNAEQSPVRFRMEAGAQWRAFQHMESAGLDLLGIYHSHPNGPDHPSETDIAESMYPAAQIILYKVKGRWQACAFQIEGGKANEIILEYLQSE
jgi:[CysO sulfur-carrier protein]-S-L-cysteine hydrolase